MESRGAGQTDRDVLRSNEEKSAIAADPPTVLIDAKGRKLTLRKLNVLDETKMMRAIGPAQANNEPYFNLVRFACMVEDIDGIPVPFPRNESQIDHAIGRINDDGYNAILVWWRKEIAAGIAEAEAAAEAVERGEEKSNGPLPQSVP